MSEYKLIVAEKPSVAKAIAAVIAPGCKQRKGYLEGSGYLISWCYGHLAKLADASYYDSGFAKWNMKDLPILPRSFRFRIQDDKKEQFDVLHTLMRQGNVTEVINACDAGREGELIFRTVYYLAGCSKPMKRLWISSMEDEAIREGFQNLQPGSDYDGLHKSALCRMKADWLVGINATRFFSITYNRTLTIGRVMSPTLSLLVQREREISAFVPEPFYHLVLDCGFPLSSEKLTDMEAAQALTRACAVSSVTIRSVERKERSEKAPALYDLTTLQREANRLCGFTAQQTLDYLQSLYEKKLCTYPRTDSRYLTNDMESAVPEYAAAAAAILDCKIPKQILPKQVCNSQKVSDHHAVIPSLSAKNVDLSTLPAGEQSILMLVATGLLRGICPEYRFAETVVTAECAGHTFRARGKEILKRGWTVFSFRSAESSVLPAVTEGQNIPVSHVGLKGGKTTPPKYYTEDTLLAAMENAGIQDMPKSNRVPTKSNDFVGEGGATECSGCSPSGERSEAEFVTTQRKGIGTPATRSGILEKLISDNFVIRTKAQRVSYLRPTELGIALITVLPEQLQSPLLTAEWEHRLKLVENGTLSDSDFMDGIAEMLTEMVEEYKPYPGSEVLFPEKADVVGKCPRCGTNVEERKRGFFCQNPDCRFVLWKNSRFFESKKKKLDRAAAVSLLKSGRVPLKGCYSEKTGKTYDATAVLVDKGDKVDFKLEFDNG